MFRWLQNKWKVSGFRLLLVLCTFALGGSLCGFLGRKLMVWLDWPIAGWGVPLYILLITLLWPVAVIAVSIPFGQFNFFKNYLRRIWHRITGKKTAPDAPPSHRLAVFASGSGSNALKIMVHFHLHAHVKVALVVCNNPKAGVLAHANTYGIPVLMLRKETFFSEGSCLAQLKQHGITAIALAGFLWRVPTALTAAYTSKIVNIHPALLPKHGGKGMYGQHVHQSVLNHGDAETGITIHEVDAEYDHGPHLFSAKCPVLPHDTVHELAARVLALEHKHYAPTIERWLLPKL
jgi:folate-dependent phosphoribosylglycinamide formyltransferase PurN